MAKNKYYAVKIGKSPGIYMSWDECKVQVTGYKGAIYKSFAEKKEAEEFLRAGIDDKKICENGYGASKSKENDGKENNEITANEEHEIIAYVDGSFLKGKTFGCGLVIIKNGEVIAEISKAYEDEELAVMRNVAGEIKASELAMQYAIDNGYVSVGIYHDYQGISSWCLGEWKTNKTGTKAYKEFYDSIKNKLKVRFIKVKGHSGDKYNDMADKLAKKAIGIV